MEFDFDRLRQLTETSDVLDYEDRTRALVREDFEATTGSVRVDEVDDIVDTIKGGGDYGVVVATRMDEVDFMVRHVNDEDLLQFDALGGWDPRALKAQRVTVHAEDEGFTDVIGSAPPCTPTEEQKQKGPKIKDVYVDLGLPAETVEETVFVDDLVMIEQMTVRMGNHVAGKAIDDHIYLFTILGAAKRTENLEATIYFAAAVQGEVGFCSVQALDTDLDPDLALGLDTTVANDVPGFDPADHVTKLGVDAGIKLKDSSTIANLEVHRRFHAVAEDDDIPYQVELSPAGDTDTGGFQDSYGAKSVDAISMPTRYLHTIIESVHEDDVATYIDLLMASLEGETGEFDYTL